jgi:hypothetical protein
MLTKYERSHNAAKLTHPSFRRREPEGFRRRNLLNPPKPTSVETPVAFRDWAPGHADLGHHASDFETPSGRSCTCANENYGCSPSICEIMRVWRIA